jgi:hypothetical protein
MHTYIHAYLASFEAQVVQELRGILYGVQIRYHNYIGYGCAGLVRCRLLLCRKLHTSKSTGGMGGMARHTADPACGGEE